MFSISENFRASPFSFAGPKRYRNVPIEIKRIPRVDIVVISHNHYDHLDEESVKDLNEKFGTKITWFVPLGIKKWFSSLEIYNVYELNWWQSRRIDNLVVFFTPAQHWSSRTFFDRSEVFCFMLIFVLYFELKN